MRGTISKLERITNFAIRHVAPILAASTLLISGLIYGCNPKDEFSTDDDSFGDDDSTLSDDDSADDDSSDDDSSGDDDIINLCPNPNTQVYFEAEENIVLGGHDEINLEYIPHIIAEGTFEIERPYCAEKYPFPGQGYDWIGMHNTPGDGLTFVKVLAIKKAIPDLFGRSLCTSTQYLRMAAGPNNLPFSYGVEYDVTACDVADNPEHPIGFFDETCCTEEGVCEIGTRSYWTDPDNQMMIHYNSSATELGWTFLGGNDPAYLVEEAEIVASGGVNFKTTSFYGCKTNGFHWHYYVGDPYTESNPDNEFDDDYIRFCLDPDHPPTEEQDELYNSIRLECGEQQSFEPLLSLVDWESYLEELLNE